MTRGPTPPVCWPPGLGSPPGDLALPGESCYWFPSGAGHAPPRLRSLCASDPPLPATPQSQFLWVSGATEAHVPCSLYPTQLGFVTVLQWKIGKKSSQRQASKAATETFPVKAELWLQDCCWFGMDLQVPG